MLNSIERLILFQHLPGVGSGTYWQLLNRFPGLRAAFEAPLSQLRDILPEEALVVFSEYKARGEQSEIVQRVRKNMDWTQEKGVHLVHMDHEHYPELLREIRRSPPLLYVLGDPRCLSFPQVAMVGSRNPTPAGRALATSFAADLASSGFTVTSGLALGVDTCAHQGAVKVDGTTIAVLGTGIDRIYPQRNHSLADEIVAKGGALVSEFPIGVSPIPQNFPQRNRIISGLSAGVLVVEAAIKSGSLITARYAVQQNREVFAIPGSINNPLARGCHALLKDGAKLVETSSDIVEELKGFLALSSRQLDLLKLSAEPQLDSQLLTTGAEETVLNQLDYQSTSVDLLTERTGLPVGDVMASLLVMELKGLVANTGSGYMRVRELSGVS